MLQTLFFRNDEEVEGIVCNIPTNMQAENIFSQFYVLDNWTTAASESSTKMLSTVGTELHRYTHEEALFTGMIVL
ncbi:hypothetical protein CAEBREN_13105 [Caenorhabditis brenneri]|uniref:Uncharacterized protein n=1 Tax=Caenorhabditis brenneri TaxID=135651 RepID=G0P157_CAEBE|nr:hypothetical protein CAEBREN_13105 [Caenorhabditis brenneri]